jgi:pimeloyl-ACP methyl ester carboxylesterase
MATVLSRAALLACLLLAAVSSVSAEVLNPQPTVNNCTKHFITQFVDHYAWSNQTYQQRYFKYDQWYKPGGPIFFYNGNEDTVSIYANWTGTMWENGQAFNALLIFAEHRYFGESMPCPGGFLECGDYLATEQAMADFASLITALKEEYTDSGIVVTFGGSYGGMLSAWMRMRYPSLVAGAIASSAPIGCMAPTYDKESYWAVVSRDATAAGGAAPNCSNNVHQALLDITAMIQTPSGAQTVQQLLHLCVTPTANDGDTLGYFVQAAFDSMAMGNYPFPTYYISGAPGFPAPAWPMRVACDFLADTAPTPEGRIAALYNAIGVMDNITGTAACYNTSGNNPSVFSEIWDFMVCTGALINEQPYFPATGPPADMFLPQPAWPRSKMDAYCQSTYGKTPRWGELYMSLGLDAIPASSNIIFANGLLDPWHSGGVLQNVSDSILALIIPEGGHHLDLFFSTPQDPPSVVAVRHEQLANIQRWIDEAAVHGHTYHHRATAASTHHRAQFRRATPSHRK